MTDKLRAYFEADLAYLADYQAKELAVAAALDDPEDRATLRRFATEGVAAELAMMASYGMEIPVGEASRLLLPPVEQASRLLLPPVEEASSPPRPYALTQPWQVALAEILPCFTVYAKEVPLPLYGEPMFREQSAVMEKMVAKYRTRYPALAPAMDAAIAQATKFQYDFLSTYPLR